MHALKVTCVYVFGEQLSMYASASLLLCSLLFLFYSLLLRYERQDIHVSLGLLEEETLSLMTLSSAFLM